MEKVQGKAKWVTFLGECILRDLQQDWTKVIMDSRAKTTWLYADLFESTSWKYAGEISKSILPTSSLQVEYQKSISEHKT